MALESKVGIFGTVAVFGLAGFADATETMPEANRVVLGLVQTMSPIAGVVMTSDTMNDESQYGGVLDVTEMGKDVGKYGIAAGIAYGVGRVGGVFLGKCESILGGPGRQ